MEKALPAGWSFAKVEVLSELIRGISYKKEQARSAPEMGLKPILRANNINGGLNFKSLVYVPEELISDNQLVQKDDIVFSMSSGSKHLVGKSARAVSDFDGSYGAFCGVVRPSGFICKPYLYYVFQENNFRNLISQVAKGSNINNLKREHILSFGVSLPPLNEQKRIVAKIEELFSELDSGIAALKTARKKLKVYRHAVLKHAFEGKLTKKWREENSEKLESPAQVIARIQKEREARYAQEIEEWKAAVHVWEANGENGRKPGKPSKPPEVRRASVPDFETPLEWAVFEFGSIAYECVLGKMLDKGKNIGEERPYLGNINVRWGKFEIDEPKTMKIEKSEIERYSLQVGDLVICEGGEPGRCAVWGGKDGAIFIQKALHRVRFTQSYLPEFAFYYLKYSVPLERTVRHFTGTTIKHLTGSGLRKVQLPVCSKAEQEEIVSVIESKLSDIDVLERELEVQFRRADILRQSILRKAFSGQLLPQDPNDEPASELLARIRAERAAANAAQKRTRSAKSGRKAKVDTSD